MADKVQQHQHQPFIHEEAEAAENGTDLYFGWISDAAKRQTFEIRKVIIGDAATTTTTLQLSRHHFSFFSCWWLTLHFGASFLAKDALSFVAPSIITAAHLDVRHQSFPFLNIRLLWFPTLLVRPQLHLNFALFVLQQDRERTTAIESTIKALD